MQFDLFASQPETVSARQQRMEPHQKALRYFFAVSGLTLDELIAEIERTQPSDSLDPVDRMGLGPDLVNLVMRVTSGTVGYLHAFRAVQHIVCTRPWKAG
jgi:hypothetical protein